MDYKRWSGFTDKELARYDVAYLNLLVAEGLPGSESIDIKAALNQLDYWADLVRVNTEHWLRSFRPTPEVPTEGHLRMVAMATALWRDIGIRISPKRMDNALNYTDSQDNFLHGILNGNGGTCASLPMAYLAIGRRLGYPLSLVPTRNHLFVRWNGSDGKPFNVECACGGFRSDDDEHYRTWPFPFAVDERNDPFWLHNISPRGEMAIHLAQRSHCLMDHLQLDEALEAIYFAKKMEPHYTYLWKMVSMMNSIMDNVRRRRDSIYFPLNERIDIACNDLIVIPEAEEPLVSARRHLHRILKVHSRIWLMQFESGLRRPAYRQQSIYSLGHSRL